MQLCFILWVTSIDGQVLLHFFDSFFFSLTRLILENLFDLVFENETVLLNEHALLLLSENKRLIMTESILAIDEVLSSHVAGKTLVWLLCCTSILLCT